MAGKKTVLDELTKLVIDFRDRRDWKQFHEPKDLSLALTLEVAEVVEHFRFKNDEEVRKYIKEHKDEIGEELADVLYFVLIMAHDLDIDLADVFRKKMEKNEKRYLVEKSKGKNTKYNKL